MTEPVTCQSKRYADARSCTWDGPRFDVITSSTNGVEMLRTPACFLHALAEIDRHYASAGIATCRMEGPVR